MSAPVLLTCGYLLGYIRFQKRPFAPRPASHWLGGSKPAKEEMSYYIFESPVAEHEVVPTGSLKEPEQTKIWRNVSSPGPCDSLILSESLVLPFRCHYY